mmetsp:Transcript_130788/g.244702  ORF Transcript_130788/g.244702 Transcript_130788/m.244702 type:complete len:480 (-) Transcript_130788:141-1580(-)
MSPGSEALVSEEAVDAENGDNATAQPENGVTPSGLKWYHWALLISIDILGPFSTDSYIPNMPDMMEELQTTEFLAGFTLQFNWMTKAVFNIVLGMLSDVIGRRPVIIYSFVFYVVGTLGASFAPSIGWLIAARVVQAVGEANDAITSAVARDTIEDPNERMRMLALLAGIRPLAIISAPSVGGVLGGVFGWRTVFRMLFLWGTANMLLTAKLIPETLDRNSSSSTQTRFTSQLRRLFCDRLTCGLMVSFALLIAGPMTMLSGISFVLEESFNINTELSSLLIGSIPIMMMIASALIGRFAKSLVPLTLMRTGMTLQFLTVIAACGVARFAAGYWWATMCVLYLMVFSQSIVIPPLNTIYFQPLKDMAGLAGGAQTCVQTFLGSFCGAIGSEATQGAGAPGLLVALGSVLAVNQFWFWSLVGFCPPRGARLCMIEAPELTPEAAADDAPRSTLSLQPIEKDDKRDPEACKPKDAPIMVGA